MSFATARRQASSLSKSFERRSLAFQEGNRKDIDLSNGIGSSLLGDHGRATSHTNAYAHFKLWVYTAVNYLARKGASQPVMAGELKDAAPNPHASTLAAVKSSGREHVDVLHTHAILDHLAQPNHVQRQFEFIYMLLSNLFIAGEAYWVTGDGDDGRLETWAIPSPWVQPKHSGGLFSAYDIRISATKTIKDIPPENVGRVYFPDPADIKNAYSPLMAIMQPAKVDNEIVKSQLQLFERGIHPNLLISVGKKLDKDGRQTGERHALTGAQRRQLIQAVREMWRESVGRGEPAILDAFIENVKKLDASSREMDWRDSGRVTKERILQCYGINEIVLGAVQGANRAQAVVAEQSVCNTVLNPSLSCISTALENFFGPMFERPQRLAVWISPCEPTDPELDLKRWDAAAKLGYVERNEFRSNVLGLTPVPDDEARSKLLDSAAGTQAAVGILNALAQGAISREGAAHLFVLFFEISLEEAETIIGDREALPQVEPESPPQPRIADEDEEPINTPDAARANLSGQKTLTDDGKAFIKRRRQQHMDVLERIATERYQRHFRRVVRDFVIDMLDKFPADSFQLIPGRADDQAETILNTSFDLEQHESDLLELSEELLGMAFEHGALEELRLASERGFKTTTAEEIAARLEIEVPAGISLQSPEWLQIAAREALAETFRQSYWQDIHIKTRSDIFETLRAAISDGKSIRQIARAIQEQHGTEYSRHRATMVARTEMTGAMNGGHRASIDQFSEEMGEDVRSEWLSVLGPTTRDSHAARDGVLADDDGLFELGGVRVPYPGHHSLPISERAQCQCSLITGVVGIE